MLGVAQADAIGSGSPAKDRCHGVQIYSDVRYSLEIHLLFGDHSSVVGQKQLDCELKLKHALLQLVG